MRQPNHPPPPSSRNPNHNFNQGLLVQAMNSRRISIQGSADANHEEAKGDDSKDESDEDWLDAEEPLN